MGDSDLVGGLTAQQREAMGLSRTNIKRVARQLRRDGKLSGLCTQEIAGLVLDTIVAENPMAFSNVQVDWDALIAFIEKLLPLILKIIDLFT